MSLAFGFGLPHWLPLSGGFSPLSLFGPGIQGTWYDPSDLSTLFQDSAGTTPVTGVEQVVGLMLDKRVPVAQTGYYSGVFDGTGDYCNTPSDAGFAFGTGDFTIEGWCFSFDVSNAGQRGIFQTSDTAGGLKPSYTTGVVIAFGTVGNGSIAAQVGAATYNSATFTVSTNQWFHFAVTRASGVVNLWVNGISVASGTGNTNNLTGTYLAFGGYFSTAYLLNGRISNFRVVKGTAVYTSAFTPPTAPLTAISGTSLLTCQNATFIDNSPNALTITAVGDAKTGANNPFGNHATATGAARPTLRARYNLLTYSEEFDQGVWTKDSGAVVVANQAIAPDGTLTADLLRGSAAYGYHWVFVSTTVTAGAAYTLSVYARAAGYNWLRVADASAGGQMGAAFFDLQNGTVGTTSGGVTATISSVGNGWYRCSISGTSPDTLFAMAISFSSADNTLLFTDNGTSGIYIWGAQLLTAADAFATGNRYQRIAAATDYDTSGFLPYLAFGGTQAMSTGSIDFTATDKMTVWAGVTKLSDALQTGLFETSASYSANNGAFVMQFVTASFQTGVRGNANNSRNYSGFGAPSTDVLTAQITTAAANSSAAIAVNVDNVFVAGTNDASAISTGNFGNHSLFIGSRNNASNYFTGRLYSTIIRGAQSTAAEISATEAWVNARTGAY